MRTFGIVIIYFHTSSFASDNIINLRNLNCKCLLLLDAGLLLRESGLVLVDTGLICLDQGPLTLDMNLSGMLSYLQNTRVKCAYV